MARRLFLLALAGAGAATPQAYVEYAAKTSAGAISSAAGDLQMGVCRVDASLFRCMHDYYPIAFKVCLAGTCLIAAVVLKRAFTSVRE